MVSCTTEFQTNNVSNNRSCSVCGWNSASWSRLDHWLCKQWKKMKAPQKYKWKYLSWKVLVISGVICIIPYPVRGQITSCLFLILSNLRAYLFILEVQHFSFPNFKFISVFRLNIIWEHIFNACSRFHVITTTDAVLTNGYFFYRLFITFWVPMSYLCMLIWHFSLKKRR